jgi:putative toxin-antitoxin system antitoxin component (TIGR02293 family)
MNTANVRIADWLGVQPPATEAEILRIVEARLAPAVINRLVDLGLERSEIDAIIIPLRTLQHRRSRRERLTIEESDRVLRVIRALSLAESVYESRERALGLDWGSTPLGGSPYAPSCPTPNACAGAARFRVRSVSLGCEP